LIGDFNVPGFGWERGVLLANCYLYFKLKREVIYVFPHLKSPVGSGSLLHLVSANFGDMSIILTDDSMVQPHQYHPTFIIHIDLSFENSIQTNDFS
jgi:hypothetical protein